MDANDLQAAFKFQSMTMTQLVTAIGAVGALGTAAFGVVDAIKILPGLLPSSGFQFVRDLVTLLAPQASGAASGSALTPAAITESLRANWINGMAYADQKSVAKTFFKLRMNTATVPVLAAVTGVDKDVLMSVTEKLANGQPMTQPEMDTYGRFDVLLSAIIDQAYQKADQRYRTSAKMVAGIVAVILTEIASYSLGLGVTLKALVVGLLATPLAPIAKDLASALTSASSAVQSVKK